MSKSLVEEISASLRISTERTQEIIINADKLYKIYSIPKHSGGNRLIYQPSSQLKAIQYWTLDNIISLFPVSDRAFAYVKGRSIASNAKAHRQSKYLFHTDIHNFFPSITSSLFDKQCLNRFSSILEETGFSFGDTNSVLHKILFRKDKLTIGAVSSPAISNAVMHDFDQSLTNYCLISGYVYTRYADDIYISSKSLLPKQIKEDIFAEMHKFGFSPNYKKTSFWNGSSHLKVTGVNVLAGSGRLTIGTRNKKMIKGMLYEYLMHGKGDPTKILGYLAYVKEIEPSFYNTLIIKYSEYRNEHIIKYLKDS
ncbi:hypothetical protein CRD60_01320 [Bifidobacterium aemilianum]|uniref:RNA-directed DNA polymerase n=1 Tax=Bifidobacterium aemilianum TaxID=2493120 RepID=A0A366KBG6_9BIFI|nr:retron St85 family RNA-directed DNA polymerase [Bifidobacterium aemilianum]RBP98528.1 hypothetical protein CRD60_01320 [Bifidobacterium aemilianum]